MARRQARAGLEALASTAERALANGHEVVLLSELCLAIALYT